MKVLVARALKFFLNFTLSLLYNIVLSNYCCGLSFYYCYLTYTIAFFFSLEWLNAIVLGHKMI